MRRPGVRPTRLPCQRPETGLPEAELLTTCGPPRPRAASAETRNGTCATQPRLNHETSFETPAARLKYHHNNSGQATPDVAARNAPRRLTPGRPRLAAHLQFTYNLPHRHIESEAEASVCRTKSWLVMPEHSKALKQRVVRRLVSQFEQPHGLAGHLAGWVMAHRISNRRRNLWVVSLLDVQPTDRVLEIGFGPGIAVETLSKLATRGQVLGIDHSKVMARQARRRNASAIRTGRVDLRVGLVEALPDFESPVDKILAINSINFWQDPEARLNELRSRLRPGGKIAIASQSRCLGATNKTPACAAREIEAALRRAGFSRTRGATLSLDPPVVCVVAVTNEHSTNRTNPTRA